MNDDIMANQKKAQVYLADQTLWAKVPEFNYEAPSTRWMLEHYTASLLILAVWIAASSMVMLRSARTASVH
jgi:hypothetical protein